MLGCVALCEGRGEGGGVGRGGGGLHREASARLLVDICVAWNGGLLKGRRYFVGFICSSLLVR